MRIAYLVNVYPSVSHSFIRREILGLEAAGHAITRLTLRRSAGALVDEDDRAEAERTTALLDLPKARLLRLVLAGVAAAPGRVIATAGFAIGLARRTRIAPAKMAAYLIEAIAIAQLCRAGRIEHLRVHFGTNPATVARLARRMGGPPFSVTVHGPDEFDAPGRWDLGGLVAESAFMSAITSYCAAQLMRWSDPADWARIAIVPCAVDARFLDPAPWPVEGGARRLCVVARLAPQKGLPLLVPAMARATAAGASLRLDIVGDGPGRADLERQVTDAGLRDRVTFHGPLSGTGVAEVIARSHAMVLPSFAEGLPVVLMEAMALGRPVITTAIAGIPELVVDGRNGWLVPAGDAAALADAIRRFAGTPAGELAAMGAAAHRDAASGHAIGVAVAALEDALDRFAGGAALPMGGEDATRVRKAAPRPAP